MKLVNAVNNKIKNILLKLEDNGYYAYVVGGFIRDYLLGIESYDVDISTNAEPKEIIRIFDLNSSNDDNYGSIRFKDSLYNYDITTFRKEITYQNRRPVLCEYIDNIEEDIIRRDFTINALYMDSLGKIYDIVAGRNDLEDKIIRVVGNIQDKMVEDPLRLLRAIRFSALLDFEIESSLMNYIRQNKQLICTLSYSRRKWELDKIFKSSNKLKGIKLIKDFNLTTELEIDIPDNIVYVDNPLGLWAQIKFSKDYPMSKGESEKIDKIRKVVNYGIIDNIALYEYGLYICIIAGEILGFKKGFISEIYKDMPIYSSKDIVIDGEDIIAILGIKPGSIIKDIIFDLEINILNGSLINSKEDIKAFLLENWR